MKFSYVSYTCTDHFSFMSAGPERTLFFVTLSLAGKFDTNRFNTILHGNILRHMERRSECRWMRRSRENNIRDTRDEQGASLANSSGCRFLDRAASIHRLCAYSHASREESVAVKKNKAHFYLGNDEKPGCLGGTMARPTLHTGRNEAGRRDPRYWKDKIKRDGERSAPRVARAKRRREREKKTTVKECEYARMRCILNSVVHCSRLFDSRERTCKHRGSEVASYRIDVLLVWPQRHLIWREDTIMKRTPGSAHIHAR